MTCKYKQDLAEVEIYCECGEVLEQVEKCNYNAYITVKPCRRCLKEEVDASLRIIPTEE